MKKSFYKTFLFKVFLIITVITVPLGIVRIVPNRDYFDVFNFFASLIQLIWSIFLILGTANDGSDQSVNRFIWLNIMLPVTVTFVNALIFVNEWIYPGLNFQVLVDKFLFFLLVYNAHAHNNSMVTNQRFRLKLLKNTRTTCIQWIIVILFHAIIGAAYATIYLFFNPDQLDTPEIGGTFNVVQVSCQIGNICSIALWIPALRAWNSDKLEFIGKNSATGEDWNGFLSKTGRMKWEIDEEPEDHNNLAI